MSTRPNEESIDISLYHLDSEELAFFKAATGIQNEVELKEHICTVQAEALAVHPYRCIRDFFFTNLKISRLPAYPQVLQLAKDRPQAVLLDLGCCFGNDVRKAIYDGWPAANAIASDLRPEFWELGHKLFRDEKSFAVPFIPGDVFDPLFLSPTGTQEYFTRPTHAAATEYTGQPLASLTSLTPLKSSISVIHASSFFHLFDKDRQSQLAHLLASLLFPLPGSIIFGSHVGAHAAGPREMRGGWAHSPETWRSLWTDILDCKVEAVVRQREGGPLLMAWSVTRL